MIKKRAVAYLRVSTGTQVDKYGLDDQLASITEYAANNNIEVVEVFRELGVTGKNELDDREALLALTTYLDANPEIKTIIIPALSRLARDLMVQETIIRDIRRRGCDVISVLEPDLCSDDPSRKLIRQIMGAINEYDRVMITLRLRGGRVQKAAKGGHPVGRAPLGYRTDVQNGKNVLQRVDDEVETVRLIFELRDERNYTLQNIADHLNDNDVRPKNWTPEKPSKWYKTTVKKVLDNVKYRGIVEYREKGRLVTSGRNDDLNILK